MNEYLVLYIDISHVNSFSTQVQALMAPVRRCTRLVHASSRSAPHHSSSATDAAHATTMRRHSASGCRPLTVNNSSLSQFRQHSRPATCVKRSVVARCAFATSWLECLDSGEITSRTSRVQGRTRLDGRTNNSLGTHTLGSGLPRSRRTSRRFLWKYQFKEAFIAYCL